MKRNELSNSGALMLFGHQTASPRGIHWNTIAAGLFLTVLLLSSVSPAAAQSCTDAYGRPVAIVFAPINDSGTSTYDAVGRPVIYINPYVWQQSSPAMRMFILGHECGHHALATTNETQADCFGARAVINAGFDIQEVLAWMARNPNSDWTHAPGPVRAAAMLNCIAQ